MKRAFTAIGVAIVAASASAQSATRTNMIAPTEPIANE